YFLSRLKAWLEEKPVEHDSSHVRSLASLRLPSESEQLGKSLAQKLKREKAIMGVFDEGCMGMYNAIVPDHLLHGTGVFKERLSQSALAHETWQVSDDEANACRQWMEERGMRFITGHDPKTELTDDQIRTQCKMYIAALRIADDFGCDCIGIQYQ